MEECRKIYISIMNAISKISLAAFLFLAVQFSFAGESFILVKFGFRMGLGMSHFHNHVLELDPSLAYSAGAVAQIDLNDRLSISPELQYSVYNANSKKVSKVDNDFDILNEVGVELHALELPLLARYNFGNIYAEAGPQFGWNRYSKLYRNADYRSPELNPFAFGIAAGLGTDSYGILLLGVRGYYSILEYAKDAKGIPWSFQAGLSAFLF